MSSPSSLQVADFIAFTCGGSAEDAARYLSLTSNNVEEAVNLYFSSTQEEVSYASSVPARNAPPAGNNMKESVYDFVYDDEEEEHEEEEEVRAAIPSKRQRLYSPGSSNSLLPGIRMVDKPTTSVFACGKGGYKSDKQEMLAKMYAPPFDIMFPGSFEELRTRAKEENKWMLVNIQKDEEFSTHILNRDVWSNDTVKELVRYGFVFWQKVDTTTNATDFFCLYNISSSDTNFPYIAILDPITKSLIKTLNCSSDIAELLGDFIAASESPSEYWRRKSTDHGVVSTKQEVSCSNEVVTLPPPPPEQQVSSVKPAQRVLEGFSADEENQKVCSLRINFPSGQKFKESFEDGSNATVLSVLKKIADRLMSTDDQSKRFDLLFGFPPKPLSKRIAEVEWDETGASLLARCGEITIGHIHLGNETVTVRFI